MNENLHLDLRHLRSITDGEEKLEKELFTLFNQTAEKCSRLMLKSLKSKNDNIWVEASHELKGAAGNLGATILHGICDDAQNSAPEKRKDFLENIQKEVSNIKNFTENIKYSAH